MKIFTYIKLILCISFFTCEAKAVPRIESLIVENKETESGFVSIIQIQICFRYAHDYKRFAKNSLYGHISVVDTFGMTRRQQRAEVARMPEHKIVTITIECCIGMQPSDTIHLPLHIWAGGKTWDTYEMNISAAKAIFVTGLK